MSDHYVVNKYRGTSTAWDIEDLVKVGKKLRACPYYGVRELKIKSHIVFCPYNYLVEPIIRKSMEISLKNNIGQAHNIFSRIYRIYLPNIIIIYVIFLLIF